MDIIQFFPQYIHTVNFFSPDSSKFVVVNQLGNVYLIPLQRNSNPTCIASGAIAVSWSSI